MKKLIALLALLGACSLATPVIAQDKAPAPARSRTSGPRPLRAQRRRLRRQPRPPQHPQARDQPAAPARTDDAATR